MPKFKPFVEKIVSLADANKALGFTPTVLLSVILVYLKGNLIESDGTTVRFSSAEKYLPVPNSTYRTLASLSEVPFAKLKYVQLLLLKCSNYIFTPALWSVPPFGFNSFFSDPKSKKAPAAMVNLSEFILGGSDSSPFRPSEFSPSNKKL